MKHVVQYKMHGDQIPYFIEDPGYFPNNGTLIGLTKDDAACYVPPSTTLVTYATLGDFVTYVVSIGLLNKDGSSMSSDDKTTLATNWWNARQS